MLVTDLLLRLYQIKEGMLLAQHRIFSEEILEIDVLDDG